MITIVTNPKCQIMQQSRKLRPRKLRPQKIRPRNSIPRKIRPQNFIHVPQKLRP